MARPLEKIVKGKRLTRVAEIEAAIDVALGLDLEAIKRRAGVRDETAADYLPSECLVHLIRHGMRQSNREATHNTVANTLLPLLLKRCEANLHHSVSNTIANAAELREDILSMFAMFFVDDLTPDSKHKLDFFEVRFNRAFKLFRIDRVRAELVQLNRLDNRRPQADNDGAVDDDALPEVAEDTGEPGASIDLGEPVFRKQMMNAIDQLPNDQRKALILHYLHHVKIESENPDETTVAKLCNVSGRTIRKRLAKALATLAKLREAA